MYKAAFSHAAFSMIGCQPISAQVPWDITRKPARSSSASNNTTFSWLMVVTFCVCCDALCIKGCGVARALVHIEFVVVTAAKEVVEVNVGPGGAEQMGSRKL